MEHGKHRGGLERCPIVAVEHGLVSQTVDPFRGRRTPGERRCVVRTIGVGDRGAHDLAAVEIGNEMESKPASRDLGRSIRHIPTPDLARGGGDVGRGGTDRPRGLRSAAMVSLPCRAQDPAEGRFTGEIHAFIGELRHDACWRHGCKARLICDREHCLALGRGQGMGRRCAPGVRASVCADFPFGGLPALERLTSQHTRHLRDEFGVGP